MTALTCWHLQPALGGQPSNFVAFLEHGAVQAACPAEAVRAREGAREFVDVLVGDGAVGRAHGGIGVALQELSLTAGEQHLGDPGGGQHADVPGAAVGHIGEHLQSEPGQAGLDRGEAADQLRMNRGESERRGSADVLAGEVNRAEAQLVDQESQGLRRGRAGAFVRCVAGVSEPGQVDGDHAVLGG